jgi:hypothetical protein
VSVSGGPSSSDPLTGEVPRAPAGETVSAETTQGDYEEPVEPVFTPEILDQNSPPGEPEGLSSAATGSTAPSSAPAEADAESVVSTADTLSATPSWRIEDRDNVRLSVQDHGVGIPARDLDRIFERFYRVDHGRSRDTGGTGLGLSIVRHVANNHQGWVDVESREGEGSTFTLVLPIQAERV